MNALIWKELRQHAAWAALATTVAAIAFAVALKDRPSSGMLYDVVQQITLLYAPVWALAIGLLQTLPETRPDRWALLVHRPISTRALFAGKAISGAILGIVPILAPFMIAASWTLTPGSIGAPIYTDSCLPGLLDLACCLPYHAAGMAIGMRRGDRLWLRRVLPVSLPLACSCIAYIVPESWMACAIIAIIEAIMLMAAHGVMASGGEDPSLAKRSRLALVAASLPATMAPIGLLILFLMTSDRIMSMGREPLPEGPRAARSWYAPDDDGTIQLRTDSASSSYARNPDATFLTLAPYPRLRLSYRSTPSYSSWTQLKDQSQGVAGGMLMYFLPDVGGPLEVFDPQQRRRLGYVGLEGLVPRAALAPRLRPDYLKQTLLMSDDALLDLVEGPRLAVRHSVHPDTLVSVAGGGVTKRKASEPIELYYLATARHIHVLRPAPAPPLVIDRPEEARDALYVSIYPLGDGRRVLLYVLYATGDLASQVETGVIAQTVSGDGHTLSVRSLDPSPIVAQRRTAETLPLPICALVPPAMTVAAFSMADRSEILRPQGLPSMWDMWHPLGWISVAITTLVACGSTLALSRRRALSTGATILWTSAAIPLGLTIPLVLLAVHPAVVRISCPRCGKAVPVSVARCASCGESEAPPDATAIICASEPVRIAV